LDKSVDIMIDMHQEEISSHDGYASAAIFDMPISKANSIAEGYLRDINEESERDDQAARKELRRLLDGIIANKPHTGSADDIHNFAVTLSRCDEYSLACRLLDSALEQYPKSVDLLADYLQYGMQCGRFAECARHYSTLQNIPHRRYTWRGFAFSLGYLKQLVESSDSEDEINELEQTILSVVEDFRRYYPYSEDTYREESSVYNCLNMPDKELEVLLTALQSLEVAPKCALRCADIYFDRGNYTEALKMVNRGITDATQTQSKVNEGYLFYLSALCRIAVFRRNSQSLEESEVLGIYSDFNIALRELNETSYLDVIKTKTNTLINQTGINVPEDYDYLSEYFPQ